MGMSWNKNWMKEKERGKGGVRSGDERGNRKKEG